MKRSVSFAFLVYVLLKGLSYPAFEVGLNAFPVIFLSAVRFDIASVLLFSYITWSGTSWRPISRGDVVAIVGGGVIAFAFATALWSVGQKLTSSTLSGLMTSLLPIFTAGFAWVMVPRDRLSPRGVVGLAVAFLGGVVILVPDGGVGFDAWMLGKVLIFLGVMGSAFGSVLVRWARPSLPAASQTAWALLVAAVLLHLSSSLLGESLTGSRTTESLVAVVFLGVLVDAVGKGLMFWLLGEISPIKVNLTAYVIPLVAGVSGWVLFGDEISVGMVSGFAVVLLGFVLMESEALHAAFDWR